MFHRKSIMANNFKKTKECKITVEQNKRLHASPAFAYSRNYTKVPFASEKSMHDYNQF